MLLKGRIVWMPAMWEEIPLRMGLVFPSRRTKLAHKRHPIITQMNKKSRAAGSPASSNTDGKLWNQRLMGILGAGRGVCPGASGDTSGRGNPRRLGACHKPSHLDVPSLKDPLDSSVLTETGTVGTGYQRRSLQLILCPMSYP